MKSDNLTLISRVTRSAVEELGIVIGDYIYAVFKASAPHLVREENWYDWNIYTKILKNRLIDNKI